MGTDLTGKEICRIIEACNKNAVSSIQLGSIKIVFTTGGPTRTLDCQPEAQVTAQPGLEAPEEIRSVEITPADFEALRAAHESQLIIDDPLSHEALMIDVHLTNPGIGFDEKTRDTRS
jgi:hypothetical protein